VTLRLRSARELEEIELHGTHVPTGLPEIAALRRPSNRGGGRAGGARSV